jgi:hypothetical protein
MNIQYQRGISSITAIFLITVLAVLAAAGIKMWRAAQDDATVDLQLQNARLAARAGLQVGFWGATRPVPSCTTTQITDMPGSLSLYAVTVTCVKDAGYTDGALPTFTRYRIQAVACPRLLASSCPNDPASTQFNRAYVEAAVTGECIGQLGSVRCRQ